MKKLLVVGSSVMTLLALALGLTLSDDDTRWKIGGGLKHTYDVAPVSDQRYIEECASCHMAYPPGLLPARSWRQIMAELDNHFGDNAELDDAVLMELTQYLVANSADVSDYRRSRRIMRSIPADEVPLRITQLPYIRHEHRELPERLVTQNPQVGSLGNCNACHQGAQRGSFREREIRIPGHGKWDG